MSSAGMWENLTLGRKIAVILRSLSRFLNCFLGNNVMVMQILRFLCLGGIVGLAATAAAGEHPETGFPFTDYKTGKRATREHAVVDTRVPREGRPVIWQTAYRAASSREERQLEGWWVGISRELLAEHAAATEKAIELLTKQLQEIVREVPASAVAKLKRVPLYLSPAYDGFAARAEYHPNAGWLREHGRDPAMAKGVEFTNVLIFEAETRRMPNFALHELAHAYHDRELANGFGNAEVIEVFKRAQASGRYDKVERQDANGNKSIDRAYALTNQQEYFAETTEAYFSRNDFFPFCREELEIHDPHACRLLAQLWGCHADSARQNLPTAAAGQRQGSVADTE